MHLTYTPEQDKLRHELRDYFAGLGPSLLMKTFLSSVKGSSASGPSSRPMPDCLKPPKGVE